MQLNNKVIISAAGSGKTTFIANDSLSKKNEKILILTYTIDNLNEIKKKIIKIHGVIPNNVKIQSWFSFLLSEGVRPYQNYLYEKKRIKTIFFTNKTSTRFVKKENVEKYYFKHGEEIYTDKISLFVKECNEKANGAVINRLELMYDRIYIDEVQDLAGYDFDILKLLFKSRINIRLVGDLRQATYSTNNSCKNKKYKGSNIYDLFIKWKNNNMCTIYHKNECFRSNQIICDLADSLYPEMEKTISKNYKITGHDGVFIINKKDADKYIKKFNPQLLRFDRRSKFNSENILNFGASKGLTFERVLIIPNGPMKKFLKTGDYSNLEASKAKYYVAFTRARYSIGILYDEVCRVQGINRFNVNDI
ncbi:UvrD-helicase domain-containing protein [Clostridium brassicae]|uniref:UvrD-helicase domain-containing protein n=1 Tax=Clostridium brassicae TaxID=2999072 RepID=A0ABT4D561_9CLOT|nr:UvrD-helicase domain-containing protein [Clostridium brassicae]MCY6957429.1 UvrD-helicase domain-containing protein [Clostridium brassicae]